MMSYIAENCLNTGPCVQLSTLGVGAVRRVRSTHVGDSEHAL